MASSGDLSAGQPPHQGATPGKSIGQNSASRLRKGAPHSHHEHRSGVTSRRETRSGWRGQSPVLRQNVEAVTEDSSLDTLHLRSDLVHCAFSFGATQAKPLRLFGILTQQHGKRSKLQIVLCIHVDIKVHPYILKIAVPCLPGPKVNLCILRR